MPGNCSPATAGSVFRASTCTEIADVFSRLKDRRGRSFLCGCELAVNLLDLLFYPTHAADFDPAVLTDQEQTRNIGQSVGIRDGVAVGIVEQGAEGNSILLQKSGGFAPIVLRDADQRDLLVAVCSVNALQEGKRVLAGGT